MPEIPEITRPIGTENRANAVYELAQAVEGAKNIQAGDDESFLEIHKHLTEGIEHLSGLWQDLNEGRAICSGCFGRPRPENCRYCGGTGFEPEDNEDGNDD